MSVIKMYDVLMQLNFRMLSSIDDLSAGEVARSYTSLMTAFNTLTIPATKEAVDWESQIVLAAKEMGVPEEEVRKQLKQALPK